MVKFSTTIKFIAMLKKMKFDFDFDFNAENREQLGAKIIERVIYGIPDAEAEFLDVLNELSGKQYTSDSDTVEIVLELKEQGAEIVKLFIQALRLKN